MTKENDRSGCTVIRVGVGTPGSICAVLALNSLQKSADLTPRAPRAGPTGGAGAALPAGMRSRWKSGEFIRRNARPHSKRNALLTTICALAFAAAFDMGLSWGKGIFASSELPDQMTSRVVLVEHLTRPGVVTCSLLI